MVGVEKAEQQLLFTLVWGGEREGTLEGGVRQGTEKGFGVPTGSEGTPSPQELEEKEVGEGWS